jgi:ribosomal protein S18 acetylase RimI-like enzyme
MDALQEQGRDISLTGGATLRFEPFDSKHLGAPAYVLIAPAQSLSSALDALRGWLSGKPRFALVTARPVNAEQEVQLAQAAFHKIETSLTFGRSLDAPLPLQADPRVGLAGPADEADCVALGRTAFVTDRYHRDSAILRTAADALKADWVRNSLRGRADRSFVARENGRAVGFNLCMAKGDTAWIDLIAVDGRHRRKGLARALVDAALMHYRERGFARMHVKTQADNTASVALYRECGFDLIEQATVYHLNPAQ